MDFKTYFSQITDPQWLVFEKDPFTKTLTWKKSTGYNSTMIHYVLTSNDPSISIDKLKYIMTCANNIEPSYLYSKESLDSSKDEKDPEIKPTPLSLFHLFFMNNTRDNFQRCILDHTHDREKYLFYLKDSSGNNICHTFFVKSKSYPLVCYFMDFIFRKYPNLLRQKNSNNQDFLDIYVYYKKERKLCQSCGSRHDFEDCRENKDIYNILKSYRKKLIEIDSRPYRNSVYDFELEEKHKTEILFSIVEKKFEIELKFLKLKHQNEIKYAKSIFDCTKKYNENILYHKARHKGRVNGSFVITLEENKKIKEINTLTLEMENLLESINEEEKQELKILSDIFN